MGRMKALFIEICNANNGILPPGISMKDAVKMKELKIYNWEEYEKKKNEIGFSKGEELKKEKFDFTIDQRKNKDEECPF